jgi:hypothetical protein
VGPRAGPDTEATGKKHTDRGWAYVLYFFPHPFGTSRERKRPLPCLQEPANSPYPEPDSSNPHAHTVLPKDPFYITLPSTFRSSELSLSRLLNYNYLLVYHLPMRATCPAHLLDLIILMMLTDE